MQRQKSTKKTSLTAPNRKENLQESQIFYRHLAELTPETVVVHQEGKIVYVNPTALTFIKAKKKSEVVGQPITRFIHPDSSSLIQNRIRTMLSNGKAAPFVEEKFITMQGDIVYAQTKAVPFTFRGKPAILAILHDITKQKQLEERQKFLEQISVLLGASIDYKTTFKNISKLLVPTIADYIRIIIVDEANKIEEVVAYHSDPKKQTLVKKLYAAYKDRSDVTYGVNRILQTGSSELIEKVTDQIVAAVKDHATLHKLVKALSLTSYMGVPLKIKDKVIGVITFSSSRKQVIYSKEDLKFAEEIARRIAYSIENALLYAEAQKAVVVRNDFISLASHELKTPLTSLKMYVQMLERQYAKKGDNTYQSYIEKMNRQTDKLTQLVSDLLDVSKIQHGKLEFSMEALDLDVLVKDTVEAVQNTTDKHKLLVEGSVQRKVLADQYRIYQVLTNLLTNAIKYSPQADKVIVRLYQEKDYAIVMVKDFGIGIQPSQQKKIFSQFYRVENPEQETFPGLGMGLYISQEIIRRHGGTMSVVSHKGKGSQFTFTLPYLPVQKK